MIRRLARFALDSIIVYLVADLVLELGGRQPAEPGHTCGPGYGADADRVEVLDRDGHLLAVFTRE